MNLLRTTLNIVSLSLILGVSYTSAQVMAPEIKCVERVGGTDIKITWKLPSNFCGPFAAYYLFADSNPNGNFNLLDSITNPSQTVYTHVGALGLAPVWYYFMKSRFFCPGFTSLKSQTINSNLPETPNIINVTVLNTPGYTLINWEQGASPETYGYTIYWDQNGNQNWVVLATLRGKSDTSYVHDFSKSDERSDTYSIASMDSCGSIGEINNFPHNTVYLQAITDRCSKKVELIWNKYNNWSAGMIGYNIYVGRNGAQPTLDTTLSASDRKYDFIKIDDGDSLCFYIEAVNVDSTVFSKSNEVCVVVETIKPPSVTYLYNTLVKDDNHVQIKWFVETEDINDLDFFRIQRSIDGIKYETIKRVESTSNPFENLSYDDKTAVTNRYSYHYRVVSVDVCGDEGISNVGKTILLTVEGTHDFYNNLNWTEYETWIEGVKHYKIARRTDDFWEEDFDFVSKSTFFYSDDVAETIDRDGTFCYRVAAVENFNQLLLKRGIDKAAESTSNVVCVTQYPNIYVPNAFAPRGKNSIFKPLLLFVDAANYTLRVYNRWGNLVYQTNNPDEGWDGIYNGEYSPQGVYVYELKFTNPDGSAYFKAGTVFLMRVK